MINKEIPIEHPIATDSTLCELGIIKPGERVLRSSITFDSGMRAESWNYIFELYVHNESIRKLHVFQRNMISMGGRLDKKAQRFFDRIQILESHGIPTVPTYGVKGATVYQEVVHDDLQGALDRIHIEGSETDEFNQVVEMGARLDYHGFTSISSFLNELVFDKDYKKFLYCDVGTDFNPKRNPGTNKNLGDMIKRFPHLKDRIEESYAFEMEKLYVEV